VLCSEEHRVDIDLHGPLPVGIGQFLDVAGDKDPGVVDQHREAAHGRVGLAERGDPLILLGDVEGKGEGDALAMGCVQRRGDFLGPRKVDVAQADFRTFLHEPARHRRAEPLGRAADERLLSGDACSSHR
jgi:hypothetical protein